MAGWTQGHIQYFRYKKTPYWDYHAVEDPSDLGRLLAIRIQDVEGKSGGRRRLKFEDIEDIERQIRTHIGPCSRCGR